MVLAKPWYHTAIICVKENVLAPLKIVKKLKLCTLQLQVTPIIQHYFNFYKYYHIFSMMIQNRTISVALECTQRQTSKKAHKIALKLQS